MTNFLKTFIGHLNFPSMKYAAIGLFTIFLVFGTTVNAWNDIVEITTDRTDWFIYNSVDPIKPNFEAGESLKFVSDVTYIRDVNVRWEDTLWCRQDGGIKKYRTQFWPADGLSERREVGVKGFPDEPETPFWEYTEEPLYGGATSCKMCWKSIGTTPHGHEKVWSDCTEWFGVNGTSI